MNKHLHHPQSRAERLALKVKKSDTQKKPTSPRRRQKEALVEQETEDVIHVLRDHGIEELLC